MAAKFKIGQEVWNEEASFLGRIVEIITHIFGNTTVDYWVEGESGVSRYFDQEDLEAA